jgi:hypothetical protein
MQLTDREREIVIAALNYMGSNVDDLNEALGLDHEDEPTEPFSEEEVFELYGKLFRQK